MENGLQGVSREAGRAKAQCKAQCSGLGERRRWLGEEVAMAMEGEMGSRAVQRFESAEWAWVFWKGQVPEVLGA